MVLAAIHTHTNTHLTAKAELEHTYTQASLLSDSPALHSPRFSILLEGTTLLLLSTLQFLYQLLAKVVASRRHCSCKL